MARTAVLGLPRIGPDRELKFALESYWAGRSSASALLDTAADLRAANWRRASDAGIDLVPSGDFSLYDHVLDTAFALGAVPDRFGGPGAHGLDTYFAMARGSRDARPLELTKWFDTNYHYLVPELHGGQEWELRAAHWLEPLAQAQGLGLATRPVVLGPFSFLLLAKGLDRPLDELADLAQIYAELMRQLFLAGASEVQIDEPCLSLDRSPDELDAFADAWAIMTSAGDRPRLTVATYFAGLDTAGSLERVVGLDGLDELHLDLVRAPGQLERALELVDGSELRLSLGVVDGRNVWRTDVDAALEHVDAAVARLGTNRVTIAPSCSLLHVPHQAAAETRLDAEVRAWLAFAVERLEEVVLLRDAAGAGDGDRERMLTRARAATDARRRSPRTNLDAVRGRVAALGPRDYERSTPSARRRLAQRERVPLPELPLTTIGSYPQTADIRRARHGLRRGDLDPESYERFLEARIAEVVAAQEELGLDVLVHGEPERNDMVEYFGERLDGFAFSDNGWVQSYGSRCVKPPILYGDVWRPEPMTVGWWRYAQSLTDKPMKGMLTGPVTILQWSFVRDDQPRHETCTQIALAISDEVADLEAAGCFAIQVDEAAPREGLPLQRAQQDDYVRWAVDCFRLAVAGAAADTQVHTHMCYSEFNDIMEHIVRLDADVLSVEASRSHMEVLDAFAGVEDYPNDIGPGVYDIHSPRVPTADEMERLLELAELRVGRARLWVNPDCGLKTRGWEETRAALRNMVEAARRRRAAGTPGGESVRAAP